MENKCGKKQIPQIGRLWLERYGRNQFLGNIYSHYFASAVTSQLLWPMSVRSSHVLPVTQLVSSSNTGFLLEVCWLVDKLATVPLVKVDGRRFKRLDGHVEASRFQRYLLFQRYQYLELIGLLCVSTLGWMTSLLIIKILKSIGVI